MSELMSEDQKSRVDNQTGNSYTTRAQESRFGSL